MTEVAAFVAGALLSAAVVAGVLRFRRPAAPAPEEPALAKERRRSEAILERMNEGVVVLDERLRPVFANPSARAVLGFP